MITLNCASIQHGIGTIVSSELAPLLYRDTGGLLDMRTLSYRITLRKEPEGGYTVLVPALPGCVTYGKTVEEAIEMARDAITGYIESLIDDGEAIPVEEDLIECRLTVEAHA